MRAMPAPRRLDDHIEFAVARLPAEIRHGAIGAGNQNRRVACAARRHFGRDPPTSHLTGHLDYFVNRIAGAIPEIVETTAALEREQREAVRRSQVEDVNI